MDGRWIESAFPFRFLRLAPVYYKSPHRAFVIFLCFPSLKKLCLQNGSEPWRVGATVSAAGIVCVVHGISEALAIALGIAQPLRRQLARRTVWPFLFEYRSRCSEQAATAVPAEEGPPVPFLVATDGGSIAGIVSRLARRSR